MEKKPICNYSGEMKELQPGDSVTGAGGAGLCVQRVTSFSTTATSFTDITNMQLSFASGKKYMVNVSFALTGGGSSNQVQARIDLNAGTIDGTYVYTSSSAASMEMLFSLAALNTIPVNASFYFNAHFILTPGASGTVLKLQLKNNGLGTQTVSCDKCYITAFEIQ